MHIVYRLGAKLIIWVIEVFQGHILIQVQEEGLKQVLKSV